ncbi:MAG: ABC-type sugar transport system, substrate-binding protein contains N-terminal xre family, partial [Microbacteriaceae bacterium]|nr:ABC-type sugar transport system, substrate-binding protein contains N-terminal xre family [Microbacteriaceae bacterium]
MSVKSFSRRSLALGAAFAVAVALAACSSGAPTGSSTGSGGGGTFTASEVAAGSGSFQVKPIFAVPKTLPKKYNLAFLNNGKSNAFFAT